MSRSLRLLQQAVLKHDPQKHGLMLPRNPRAKYHEFDSAPTNEQLQQHLTGSITLAAPAVHQGRAATIMLDVDAEALTRVPLLIEAARQHQLWAWGEIHETSDRGYVHIPFTQLTSAAALKHLGDTLIAAAGLQHVAPKDLDNRTMNHAITRLPFGVHTWTARRGLVVFPDGASYDLNTQLEAGLAAWCDHYTENPLPANLDNDPATPTPPARQSVPAPRSAPKHPQADEYSPADIQRMYNERHDVCTILAAHGGRRGSRQSWHCPCGQHAHNDAHGSLQIAEAKNPKYGNYIVQGFSASCAFFSDPRRTYDAFNVYATLNRLSNGQMLKHAREALGITPTPPSRPTEHEADEPDHHQRRRAPRPTPTAPPAAIDVMQTREDGYVAFDADEGLTKAAQKVYKYLYRYTPGISCRPSIARIASDTGIHARTVQRALRQLEAHGHLTTNHTESERGDQTSIYTFRLPPAFLPPDIKLNTCTKNQLVNACKGGASRPPAPPSLSVAVEPAPPAVAGPDQLHGAKPIFPQKVTLQNICTDEIAPNGAASDQAAPSVAVEPALPTPPERLIVARRRVFLRTVDDLAETTSAQVAALPPSATPAAAAPRSASVPPEPASDAPGATFSPLPEGLYCDPDTGDLRPIPPPAAVTVVRTKSHQQLVAEQTASATRQAARNPILLGPVPVAPTRPALPIAQPVMALGRAQTDTCPDELAVVRDCVHSLRVAAMREKTKQAWGRYHREHARLVQLEQRLHHRTQSHTAPPLHAKPAAKKQNRKGPVQLMMSAGP